jgi:DNA-binding SARP family transcriptional activator
LRPETARATLNETMPEIEFLLLGPLEVKVGPRPLRVSGRRQRALLACLLLGCGRPIPTPELVASVYGEAAGPNALHALHELVSNLRRTLEPIELDELLRSEAGSYSFDIDPERLDAWLFEDLVRRANVEDDSRLRGDLLQRALELWRGPALAGVELDGTARASVERLEELRWGALADWIDLELTSGRHQGALVELEQATRLNPFNERLRSQLMLALYREGRQADALRVYHETRNVLAEELGLEPGESLRTLERRILNHDPELLAPDAPRELPSPKPRRGRLVAASAALVAAAVGVAFASGAFSAGGGRPAVFVDSMKGSEINTKFWDVESLGAGPTVGEDGSGALLTMPAHATPTDSSGTLKARMSSYCTLAGAFDVPVDSELREWPAANGTGIGMYAAYADVIRESAPAGERYVGAHRIVDPPDGTPHAVAVTKDTRGALRVVRSGDRMIELVREGGSWHQLYAFGNPTPASVSVYLELWTSARRFSHRQVEVRLTNFRVNSGSLQCPSG